MTSIWEDDHIERLENNQWKFLWCNIKFQDINSIIGTPYMHIKRCIASMYQAHLSRYKDLQLIKSSNKGLLNDYLQKMISYISLLQDKSSEVVVSNIQRNYRVMSPYNITITSDTSSLRTSCITSPGNSQIPFYG